jgi:hypothetical protein
LHDKSPKLLKDKCVTEAELAERLWTTFQYNGYIAEAIPYTPPVNFTKQAFMVR